jgi:hypothetical protein
MGTRPITLTDTEHEEHERLLFECTEGAAPSAALRSYLAELILLRKLKAATRAAAVPPKVRLVLDRLPFARQDIVIVRHEPSAPPPFDLHG